MSTVAAVLAFAALFGGFALMAPVIRRKRCSGGSCGSCSSGSCKYTE